MKTTFGRLTTNRLIFKYFSVSMFLLALAFQALHAQSNSFFIGGTAGTNFTKFKYTDDLAELYSTSNRTTGYNGGFTAGMLIGNFTITTGLQYIQKGGAYETANFSDEVGTGFFSAKEKLHYISVPLLLGYRQQLGDRFGAMVSMGPSLNMGLKGKIDETTEYYGLDEVSKEFHTVNFGSGVNDDYAGMQVGFQFSPGVYFDLTDRSKITLNVTWDSGLQDAFNSRYKQANTFFDEYKGNQFLKSTMISVGYEFHLSFEDKY